MFYDFAITVPAGTTEVSPIEQELNLTYGVIHRIEVEFPIGCRALAHCQIYRFEHQDWPTNIDGSFASDGYVIAFNEHYDLFEAPFNLKVKCWNDDDTYQHVITVRVGILPKEIVSPWAALGRAIRGLLPW